MRRIPLPLVMLLSFAVIGGVWWRGTRNYDFLTSPNENKIEMARTRAAQKLATPSDLFAVEKLDDLPLEPIEGPKPPPKAKEPPPVIEPGDLNSEITLDLWSAESGKPAISFINLASALEADTQLARALIAWERVLDSSNPDATERNAALNGIRRLRATIPPWTTDDTQQPILLQVQAPADRLQLTRRAATQAASRLQSASSGLLPVASAIQKSRTASEEPKLLISLTSENLEETATVEVAAPDNEEEIEAAILSAAFKLVASQLSLDSRLAPVSSPAPGETAADSLLLRITRLGWQHYAESLIGPAPEEDSPATEEAPDGESP